MDHESLEGIQVFASSCSSLQGAPWLSALEGLQEGHTLWRGQAIPAMQAAEESIARWVQERKDAGKRCYSPPRLPQLTADQEEAVHRALRARCFFLEGGPGTGKTYCAAAILTGSGAHSWIALAPTGKAKAQLESSLIRAGLPLKKVMTLQGALQRETGATGLLAADFVLVDECSMIDSGTFYRLVRAIPANTPLLLLGDRLQLPPVGPGQPFADLCTLLEGSSLHARLDTSLRVEEATLLNRAQRLRHEQRLEIDQALPSPSRWFEQVYSFHKRCLPHSPQELMAALGERLVLSALVEGPWGSERAAQELAGRSVDPQHPWRPMPIMVRVNAERIDLWNGDLGWLCQPPRGSPFALFPARRDAPWTIEGGIRSIPLHALPPWEPAWVLSVHKAQGSESRGVLVAIPPGSERFGLPLLYTALTRARQSCTVCAHLGTLQQMLQAPTQRSTCLQQCTV